MTDEKPEEVVAISEEDYYKKVSEYVRLLADKMALKDWKFEISRERCEEDSHASITCAEKRKVATINFSDNFLVSTPEEQRHTVCHELIHPHIHQFYRAVYDLAPTLGESAFRVFRDRCEDAMEYCVDGLADAFAQYLPTITDLDS